MPTITEEHTTATTADILTQIETCVHKAIHHGASDIHFEPYENTYRIRARYDGLLYDVFNAEPIIASRIAARFKILSGLDSAEKRVPQDGRLKLPLPDSTYTEFRISTCPTLHGEKLVLRSLNQIAGNVSTLELGFDNEQHAHFLKAIEQPQGLILVTGPTGSGKTATLYAALQHLNTGTKNIMTVEDPVEWSLPGINQTPVNVKVGLTFSSILKSILRQDPDIIMIGEIRDNETAEIALKAAHTGHLVFSTLHTNNAASTLIRLSQMGIPTFQFSHVIHLIVAQRLLRCVCSQCIGKGCAHCHRGYHGRTAVFEVMPITSPLRDLLHTKCTAQMIIEQAKREGMKTLYESAHSKINQGLTTREEVQRILGSSQDEH